MKNINHTINIINNIILETELKDIFNEITIGDELLVHTDDNYYQLKIINKSNSDMSILVEDSDTNQQFIINKSGIQTDKIVAYKKNDNGASPTKMTIKVNSVGIKLKTRNNNIVNLNGKIDSVDNEDEEDNNDDNYAQDKLFKDIRKFNNTLINLKQDDSLLILVKEPVEGTIRDDGNFIGDDILTFTVNDVKNNFISLNLNNAEGPNRTKYLKLFLNRRLILNKKNLVDFNEDNTDLVLPIVVGDSGVYNLNHINYIVKNNVNISDKNRISKKDISNQIMKDKDIQRLLNKQPKFVDSLLGAGPTGIYNLKKIAKKNKVLNSYLTKGKRVTFILRSNTITGTSNGSRYETLKKDLEKGYIGVMMDDNTIKRGPIDKKHWRIDLLNDRGNALYDANIFFYHNSEKHNNPVKGIVEIIDIN